jgi:nucleoside-diphosphate-sugar epimerase
VPSNPPRTQAQALADLARLAGAPEPRVSVIPRSLLLAVGLFNPTIRELRETEYQFTRPFVMDATAACEAFGLEPTPWEEVLAATLSSYGVPLAGAGGRVAS